MAKNNSKNTVKVEPKDETKVEALPEVVETVREEAVQEAPAPVVSDVDPDPRWTLDVWHDVVMSKIGQPSFVLTAAMDGQDAEREYSEPEVRRLVEKFLNTPAR